MVHHCVCAPLGADKGAPQPLALFPTLSTYSYTDTADAGFALKLVVATVLQICSHKGTLCSICCFWQSVLAMMSCRFGGLLTSQQFVYVTELFNNCVALLKAKLPNVKGVFGIIGKVPRILSRGVRSS